jgi:hypothetical protein
MAADLFKLKPILSTEVSLLNKRSSSAALLGVTEFIAIIDLIVVRRSDLGVQQTGLCPVHNAVIIYI